jgi:hypothetical protein
MAKVIYNYRVLLSISLYVMLFGITLSLYRHHFDVDGLSSMMIAIRVANHDWFNSINGVWSPLNCWLAALVPGMGQDPVFAFKLINAFCSIGIIIVFHELIKQLVIAESSRKKNLLLGVSLILPVILLSHTHFQLSGDLLQLFIVLLYMLLVLSRNYFCSVPKNLSAGVLIALAYLSKSFNLPFLLATHLVVHFIAYFPTKKTRGISEFTKPLFLSLVTVLVIIAPWIYILYSKYNIFTFSTVKTYNFHWLLNDKSYLTLKSDNLLIPPPYPNSPTAWEDPYLYYASFSGPFDSLQLFLHFLKNILHNFKMFLQSMTELSFLSFFVLLYYLMQIIRKKETDFKMYVLVFMSSFAALGYMLIYIEARYIWLTGLLLLIAGVKLITEIAASFVPGKVYYLVCAIFLGSFLLTPVDNLQDMQHGGEDLEDTKTFLKANGITGNFTAVNFKSGEGSWCDKLAFVSTTRFFRVAKPGYSQHELLQACKKNNINFLLYFYNSPVEKEFFSNSEIYQSSKGNKDIPGKNVLLLQF